MGPLRSSLDFRSFEPRWLTRGAGETSGSSEVPARLHNLGVEVTKHRRCEHKFEGFELSADASRADRTRLVACAAGDIPARFRAGRTFALFALLATGLVAQAARRTVVGMLAGAGMAAVVSFHAVCRFFSRHAWDADRIGLTLARLIVARLLAAHAAIDVVVDDTLIRRWGPKVFGAFWTHDGSAQDPNALGRGNRWIIAGSSSGCRSARTRCACRCCCGCGAARAPPPRCGWPEN